MAKAYQLPYDRNQVDALIRHYRNQNGLGGVAVYRGTRLQSGAGLGNILASIGRFLLPIIAPAATTFIGSALRAKKEGKSFKEAAKEALEPTVSSALRATSKQIKRKMSNAQTGGRRAKRRRPGQKKLGQKHRKTNSRIHQLVYKGMNRLARKRKSKVKSTIPRKRVRYLKQAFANF